MLSRRAPVVLACLCACAVALVGCGSTTVHHVTTTITSGSGSGSGSGSSSSSTGTATSSSTTSSRTRAARSPASRSPLAGRSPRAILELAAATLRRSGGYAMRADLLQSRRRTVIDLTADGTNRYAASLSTGRSTFSLITVPGAAYLRGNQAFWTGETHGGTAAARRLAGHWLHVPDSGAHSVASSLGTLAPGTLARCLTEDHGALTVAGHTTIAGRRALIVRDAGNAPGATPSTIAVASSGSPEPLRYDATGATRPGGRVDVCNDGKGDGATGTITLSQFGDAPPVQAPASTGSAPGTGI